MTQFTGDLSKILSAQLESRCQRNPRYSLRAFARDLGVPASRLSRWMKGTEGMSRTVATQLAKKLNLSASETEAFVLFVETRYARSKRLRTLALERLKKISDTYHSLDVEAFKVIADWYHLATLSLMETKGFRADADWISRRLGVTTYEIRAALNRLMDLEMIERVDGSYRPTGVFFVNPAGIPSQSVRSFHKQILEKAQSALEFQSTQERDVSTLVLAVDENKIDDAKLFIKQFREEFESRFCKNAEIKNQVYALGVQFFRLSEFKSKTLTEEK